LPAGTVCLGEPITFTVTIKNEGGCTAGASVVKYYIDGVQTDSDYISGLSPGSTSTQTFTWTSNSCGSVSVKAIADANNNVHECDENNNEKQKSVEVVGPDLIVEDIILPTGTVCLDQPITIIVKVKNDGACVAGPSTVKYYVDGQETDSDSIPGLSPGATSAQTFTWTPTTCGTHTIKAIADANNNVHECDENNNEKQKSVEVEGPDLIIHDITLPPGTVCLDQPITITVTVKNDGKCTAGASTVKYYVDGQETGSASLPSMGPGSSASNTFIWTPDTCGTHTIKAVADANKNVKECDENNNEKQKSIEVAGPDLIIGDITLPPGTVCLDQPITITVTVTNQGGCTAGSSTVKYYADGQETDSVSIPGLSPGATSTQTFSWTPNTCGTHTIKAVADANKNVKECDENNNEKQKSIEVDGPDLIVENIVLPAGTVCLDQPTTITVTIKNQGGCTAGTSTAKYYVDGQETGSAPIPGLSPGATSTQAFTWTPTTCGNHEIKAVADVNDDVKECDENNNELQKSIEVKGPDLIIQDITLPTGTVCLDKPTTFTVIIKNDGDCTADSSTVKYYINGGETDSDPVPSLSPGATSTQTFPWTPDSCGSASVKAIADANDNVKECDENNNVTEKDIEVDGPDLIVEEITWPPGTVCLDQPITITVTVKNQGGCDAGSSTVKYYVDGGEAGSASISGLSHGSSASNTFTWTPDTCGTHTIKAIADVNDDVKECDENNNVREKNIEVDGPDLVIEGIIPPTGTVCIDSPATMTVKVKNQGGCTADPSTVKYYIDGSHVNSGNVPELSPGSTSTQEFIWTPISCGSHEIKAVADTEKSVEECDENNNEKITSVTAKCPDLRVEDIEWNPPDPEIDESITFTVTIKNHGECDAGASHAKLLIDGSEVNTVSIGSISAGSITTGTFIWTASGCGDHSAKAIADCNGEVTESDDGNNDRVETVRVTCPDLIVEDILCNPPEPEIDQSATFTVKIRNTGDGDAKSSHARLWVGGSDLGAVPVGPISAGSMVDAIFTWTASDCGDQSVKAVADCNGEVTESDDGNNERMESVHVRCPDLIIQSLTPSPPDPKKGDSVTFTVITKNKGDADADSSHTRLFIKHFEVDSASSPVGPIAAGATASNTFTWTVDSCGSTGVSVIADADKEVDESDEDNNYQPETIYVKCPDLEIIDISWSPEDDLHAGDDVTISYKIKNKGDADAEEFTTSILIDSSPFGSVTQSISANTEMTVEVGTWKAVEGAHPIKVEADAKKKVDEFDETNNEDKDDILVGVEPVDLTIFGVEVNQGIQGFDNDVSLIYGKPAFVRVYVKTDSREVEYTGKLYLIQDETIIPLKPINKEGTAKAHTSADSGWMRVHLGDSLNFYIDRSDWSSLNSGTIELKVEINPDNGDGTHPIIEKNYKNNDESKYLTFNEVPPLKLLVELNYHMPSRECATDIDLQRSLSCIKRVYPISDVDCIVRKTARSWGSLCYTHWVEMVTALHLEAWAWGKERYYIMLVSQNAPCDHLHGLALQGGYGAVVRAMTYEEFVDVGKYSLTMPHEIGHLLGFKHVDCGGPDNIGYYPYYTCFLDNDITNHRSHYGLDIETKKVIAPGDAADLMSYGQNKIDYPRWISKYNYERIFVSLTSVSSSSRYLTGNNLLRETELGKDYILVSGTLNPVDNEVIFNPFYELTNFNGAYQPGEGNYSMELRDNQSTVLLTHSFELSYPIGDVMFAEGEPEGEIGFFVEIIPYPPETKTLVLKHNSTELASITVSDHAPNVTVISPNGGETLSCVTNITWLASDLDGDKLHYIVEYSPDNGSTWETLAINFNDTRYPLNTDYIQGTTEGLIRITASDGVNTGTDVSGAVFTVLEKPPEVCIVNPINGTTVTEGSHISFSGAGYDLEDGMLNDSTLTWISDQNGILGTGGNLWTRNLTRGVHTITLMGEDSDGNRATDQITISVLDSATIDTPMGTARLSVTDGVIIGACRVNESLLPHLPETDFPFGVFAFNISDISNGQTVNISIDLPQDLPCGAAYWKYGRTIDNTTPHWYEIPMEISEDNRTVTIQLTDGGMGDDDLTANGVIVDAGAPGVPETSGISGDLNSDGILTPADAAIALHLAANGGWDPAADVNNDSRITSLDALMILQAAGDAIDL
jgi:subtilase family serine protease